MNFDFPFEKHVRTNEQTNKHDKRNEEEENPQSVSIRYIGWSYRCRFWLSSSSCFTNFVSSAHTQTHHHRTVYWCRMEYETGGYKNLSYMLPPSNQWSRFEAHTDKHMNEYSICMWSARVTDTKRKREKKRVEYCDCCYLYSTV